MNCSFNWSDEFLSGDKKIDIEHKIILSKACKLHDMIADSKRNLNVMFELANEIADAILEHMDLEIELLKKYNLDWFKHEIDHNEYKKKYDLEKNHKLLGIIRVLLVEEMVKEYMQKHFFEYDVKDMKKIGNHLKKREKNNRKGA